MRVIITALLLFFSAVNVFADIYKYEGPDGTVHFSEDASDPRFQLFMKNEKPLVIRGVIHKRVSGNKVYMVNSTSNRGYYYWLFGGSQRALVMAQKDGTLVWQGRWLYRSGDEVRDKVDKGFVWLKGTPEFDCFVVTKKHLSR